jgi:hypothetical protein
MDTCKPVASMSNESGSLSGAGFKQWDPPPPHKKLECVFTVSQAQNKASCPAKYRYQFFYQLNDPTPENIKAIDALLMKRMREECDKEVLAFGHGGAISTKPSTYG